MEAAMFQTVQVSSCVSAQGDFVETLPDGDVLVRDGGQLYRGRPIVRDPRGSRPLLVRGLRPGASDEA
jgi:hypothetical protein